MSQKGQPLAEVFGHLTDDRTDRAERFRSRRLCPFNNRVPNCTKDKAKDPLGVCSVYHENEPVITCPIRFRQDWIIADDAASFFFDKTTKWSSLTEVRLNDSNGKSAGNIDLVLVAYDDRGRVLDFGALEIQAVYISGNVREPFERYMSNPQAWDSVDWTKEPYHPCSDYLSSFHNRLVPKLTFRGGILHYWGKKVAIALNRGFFNALPSLREVSKGKADIAWMVYDVVPGTDRNKKASRQMTLVKHKVVYSKWPDFLKVERAATGGDILAFSKQIDAMLDGVAV